MPVVKFTSAALLCLILVTACSRRSEPQPPGVSVEGSDVPTFTLYGEGRLGIFEIYEDRVQPDGGEVLTLVWSIGKFRDVPRLEELGTIKYGVIPQGYEQSYPPDKRPPQPLDAKQAYDCWLRLSGNSNVIVREIFSNNGMRWLNSMARD